MGGCFNTTSFIDLVGECNSAASSDTGHSCINITDSMGVAVIKRVFFLLMHRHSILNSHKKNCIQDSELSQ